MAGRRARAVMAAAAILLTLQFAGVNPADAHGAPTRPGSRTYLCRIDGTHASGDIQPSNAACAAAVAIGGKQPLWDWFGVLRSDGAGRTRGYIPDGQLCSGGEPKFAGYDLARADWPYTSLSSGTDLTVRYNAWAAHPGEFRLYVTKDGYDPTKPLAWDDLEDEPFSVYQQNTPNGNDAQNSTPDYQWNVSLPQKSGPHIIYSVWSRSDSDETFYGCSDVRFDGGSGQVLGIGAGANPVGAPEGGAPATTIAPNPAGDSPTTSVTTPDPYQSATTIAPEAGVNGTMTEGSTGEGADAGLTGGLTAEGEQAGPDSSIAGTVAATDGSNDPQTVLVNGARSSSASNGQPAANDTAEFSQVQLPVQTSGGGSTTLAMLGGALLGLLAGVAGSIAVYATLKAKRLEEYLRTYDRNRPQPHWDRIDEPEKVSPPDDTKPEFSLE